MTNLDLADLMADLELRFTSANEIPVERASLRATEWRALKAHIGKLRVALRQIANPQHDDQHSTDIAAEALRAADEPSG